MGMDTFTGLKPRVQDAGTFREHGHGNENRNTNTIGSQSQGTALTAGTLKQWLAKNATRPYLNRLRGR